MHIPCGRVTGARNFLGGLAIATGLLAGGCGVNPVTGESELQFISESSEIQMGEQSYAPARQSQGGDYVVDEALVAYVQAVGNKLAAVSDRALPYEFAVINNPVPNAWAMPGGKISVNRGLLLQLQSEAELAAVLGHEIVHAAARHGAQSQEMGMLLQGGVLAASILTESNEYGGLIAGGAMLGTQLISSKYGRKDELEADKYGMKYMVRAGYDPLAAVELQKTFVRLAEGSDSNWLSGLFASHPPSQARVDANIITAQQLGGDQGFWGKQEYARAMATLRKDQPAYAAHDEAMQAAQDKQFPKALTLVDKAIKLQADEAVFYGLRGDIYLAQKQYPAALASYDEAISLNASYFGFYLQQGMAYKALGEKAKARKSLDIANSILPTALAHKELGDMALASGQRDSAVKHYQFAAQSSSATGEAARISLARLDLPGNPARYIDAQVKLDNNGQVVLLVTNHAPVAVTRVKVDTAYFDPSGRQLTTVQSFFVRGEIGAGKSVPIYTKLSDPNGLRTLIAEARVQP